MKISVMDLGVNNIRSVIGALEYLGLPAQVASRPEDLGGLCLIPGIGNFGFVSQLMLERGWTKAVRAHAARGYPVLGICLGMQLLFESSSEAPEATGLGIFSGSVADLSTFPLGTEKLPVTGWRKLQSTDPCMQGHAMYFNHSFGIGADHPQCLATYVYGQSRIAAVVGHAHVMGLQFHPEKSGIVGLELLRHCIAKISQGVS